jgi:hypothetical protein
MRALFAGTLMVLAAPAAADDKAVVGVWKHISVVQEDVETKERVAAFGAQSHGFLIITPEGQWTAITTAGGRTVPKTEAEKAAAFESMIAYSGKYRIEGNKVTVRPEVAWNESYIGTDQIRFFRLDGDRMLIASAPRPNPNMAGKVTVSVTVWEREKF